MRWKLLLQSASVGLLGMCAATVYGQADLCADASVISYANGLPNAFDLSFYGTQHTSTCTPPGERDAWFKYTVPAGVTGPLHLVTSIPAIVSVYNACPADAVDVSTQLACSNVVCEGQVGRMTVPVTSGQTYLIRVAASGNDFVGTLRLYINDSCPSAFPVSGYGEILTFDLAEASIDGSGSCLPARTRDLWYRYPAPAGFTGTLWITSSATINLSVFSGCPADSISTGPELHCNTVFGGQRHGVAVSGGQTYYIRLAAKDNQLDGTITFLHNDTCGSATPAVLGTAAYHEMFGAAGGPDDGGSSCGTGFQDVWFRYAPTGANKTFVIMPRGGATQVARWSIFTTCPSTPSDLSQEAACLSSNGGTRAKFAPVFGQTYYIRAAQWSPLQQFNGSLYFVEEDRPANDTCAGADAGGSLYAASTATAKPISLIGATSDNTADCAGWDVWYTYTATFNGVATAAVAGVTGPRIAIYSGCPTSASDISTLRDCAAASSLSFAAVSGTKYYIRIAKVANGASPTTQNDGMSGTLTISQANAANIPPNDQCANAIALVDGAAATAFTNLANASRDGSISCGTTGSTFDIWYKYTPVITSGVKITVTGAIVAGSNGPTLGVFTGCPTSPLSTAGLIACNNATVAAGGSNLSFHATTGNTYYIRLSRRAGTATAGSIAATTFTPAQNDTCATALPLLGSPSGLDNQINLTNAVIDDALVSTCGIARDVWYFYDSSHNGSLHITGHGVPTANANGVSIAIFDSCSGPQLDCATILPAPAVSARVVSGHRYYIRVTGAAFINQIFTLKLREFAEVPVNDVCATAPEIHEGMQTWNNTGATIDRHQMGCQVVSRGTSYDVWYKYVPTFTGHVRAEVAGEPDLVVSRHASCTSDYLHCDDGTYTSITLAFAVTAGEPVYLRLAKAGGFASVPCVLDIYPVSPPSNDNCDSPLVISTPTAVGGVYSDTTYFDSTDATGGTTELNSCGINGSKDLWFAYTPPASEGTVVFNTCPMAFTDASGSYPRFSAADDGVLSVVAAYMTVYSDCNTQVQCTPTDADTCFDFNTNYHKISVTFNQPTTLLLRVTAPVEGHGLGRLYTQFTPSGPDPSGACAADFDKDGVANIDDIFIFLNAWFAGCTGQSGQPCFCKNTDINNSGLNIDDIFIFLNLWFRGC